MPDGTKIYMDGTVEYADKVTPPSAVLNYQNIASSTDVYVYYADFDADEVEDVAIWYDGAFRAVCLLDENGNLKKTYPFETGADIYHTYNQRAVAIKHEPNLIRIVDVVDGVESVHYFQVEKDDLYLNAGVKYDPNGSPNKWFCSVGDTSVPYDSCKEIWEPITEESYQRIADDYQVMQYRLIPIA